METKIFIKDGKSYMEVKNVGDTDQTENFKIYSLEESDEENLIVQGPLTVSANMQRTSMAIETLPVGTSNTIYKVVIGGGVNEKYKYFPRGTLGATTVDDTRIKEILAKYIMMPTWETVKRNGYGGWNAGLKRWYVYMCPADKETIGYGHKLVAGDSYTTGLNDADAKALLIQDITDKLEVSKSTFGECYVNGLEPWAKIVLLDLVFNIGENAVANSYPRFRKSLADRNYGTEANKTDASKDGGPTWREHVRGYYKIVPDELTTDPTDTIKKWFKNIRRCELVETHLLPKLTLFKR